MIYVSIFIFACFKTRSFLYLNNYIYSYYYYYDTCTYILLYICWFMFYYITMFENQVDFFSNTSITLNRQDTCIPVTHLLYYSITCIMFLYILVLLFSDVLFNIYNGHYIAIQIMLVFLLMH